MVDTDRQQRLHDFVAYARTLAGDEKGEAQVFLDRLFRAFGQRGCKEAGAVLEARIRKQHGGTSFADLVWKPRVLIEMKKRGEDLSRHLQQAFEYWTRIVPGRPRYVVLCNFDQFRIYDFDVDLNEPQDTLSLDELPARYDPLAFLFPTDEKPRFRVDRVKVTREAADYLAQTYSRLAGRKNVGPDTAQRFILQMLVALFSEDIGLLPRHFVTQLLDECVDPPKSFDLLRALFTAMNTKAGVTGGRFKDIPYFNGGIFAHPAPVELDPENETALLKRAAAFNWAHISPDIFGTIFQHSMSADDRHRLGGHYTAPTDIMKIVLPTIIQPWRAAIDDARDLPDLRRLHQRLYSLRILDPACGSGNFLYIAYRELKRLEADLVRRIDDASPKSARGQHAFGFVTAKQFFGLDIIPFAVELAKVTMTLARKLAIDELHSDETALPLDNLDSNILCKDALIDANGAPTPWPRCDIIIGNPPFLGAKRLKPERGADYVNAVRAAYPDVPGMADYCVYWFRRAHDHLPACTPADPFAGRAGLVGTQNIRNNQSRVGGLDHIVNTGGIIVEAVENQPWSGEANVHVSIANWIKTSPPLAPGSLPGGPDPSPHIAPGLPGGISEPASVTPVLQRKKRAGPSDSQLLLPPHRRLWSKIDPNSPSPHLAPGESPGAPVPAGSLPGVMASPHLSAPTSRDREGAGNARGRYPLAPGSLPGVMASPPLPGEAREAPGVRVSAKPATTPAKRGRTRADKSYELAPRDCASISASLSDKTNVSGARILQCNVEPQRSFSGQVPGHDGFVLSPAQAKAMIAANKKNKEVIWPFLIGRDMLTGNGQPTRFVIDFQEVDMNAASVYSEPFAHVREHVLPTRRVKADQGKTADGEQRSHHRQFLKYWWRHSFDRPEMIRLLATLSRYIVCSDTTKRPVFMFIARTIRPDHKLRVFAFEDDYSFGILQSHAHWLWFVVKCSKLKSDFNYTSSSVYDPFPWPQSPTKKQINAVAASGREIRAIRANVLPTIAGGLRALYRTLELPGKNPLKDAHAALDAAVLDAFAFSPKADILAQLLDLNLSVATRIDNSDPVTSPGLPPSFPDPSSLITTDCIQP